jgi:hypothetical protein
MPPIDLRGNACHLSERRGEMRLTGESNLVSNFCKRITMGYQQRLGSLNLLQHYVPVRK